MIGGVLLVVLQYGFGKNIFPTMTSKTPSEKDVPTVPFADVMTEEVLMGWARDEQNHVSVTGTIMEVLPIPEQEDVQGTEVKLHVVSVIDPELYPTTEKAYLYFLSNRDTENFFEDMAVDDVVTITSVAPPTDEAYIVGEKVEKKDVTEEVQ